MSPASPAPSRPTQESTAPAAHGALWTLANVALVVACSVVAIVVRRDFFYFDDTPGGAMGQWYELGQQLAAGVWPMLNLEAWMAGNYLVEQWGLFNPPTLAIALLATQATNLALFASGVKIVFLVIGALGVQYLARTLGVPAPWAAIAGASAALAGFTFFMDATTWVTQLMVWAWSGWTYAGLLRWASHGKGLVLALVGGYLVITVGYVHGTLFLILFFVALLVQALIQRSWASAVRTLAAGVVLGLVTVAVYLPALQTSALTVRAQDVSNTGFMTYTLNAVAVAAVPMASPDVTGWWGRYADSPITYIAWFLPLLVLVPTSIIRRHARLWLSVPIFGILVLALAVGPSDLAMFRYPVRAMPWIAMVALVLAARWLSELTPTTARRGGLTEALLLVVGGYWVAWSANPYQGRWLIPFGLVVAACTWVAAWVAGGGRLPWRLHRVGLAAVVGAITVVMAATQVLGVARRDPGFGVRGFPDEARPLTAALAAGRGEAIIVGDMWAIPADQRWKETSTGNLWYLVDNADVMNLYSPSGFLPFNHDLCMDTYYGRTCQGLLDRLFERDERTGALLVDLLSIDTIQVLEGEGRTAADLRQLPVPPGWSLIHAGDVSVTWARDVETPGLAAGAWTSPGLVVAPLSADDVHVKFQVQEIGPEGGWMVLPRLAWPGYDVTGGTKGEPERGYLLTVEVPAGTPVGSTIEVTFRPPGWGVQLGAFGLAGVLALALALTLGRRRTSGEREGAESTGSAVS